jgi:hypothetical protein
METADKGTNYRERGGLQRSHAQLATYSETSPRRSSPRGQMLLQSANYWYLYKEVSAHRPGSVGQTRTDMQSDGQCSRSALGVTSSYSVK